MMGQINPVGFQFPMCVFYVYVIVEIKYFCFWLWQNYNNDTVSHIDGLVQERRNSIANALELRISF